MILQPPSPSLAGEEKPRLQLDVLARAIEASPAAIVVTNARGLIEYVNPAFTVITGYSAEEAVGESPRVLKSGVQDAAFYQNLWTTIRSGRVWHGDFTNRRKDGSLFLESASISPVLDASGEITHYVAVKSDVTDQRRLESELRAREEQTALALLGAEDGLWDWDLRTDAVYYSPRWLAMVGYGSGELAADHATFTTLVHPEDMPRVQRALHAYLHGKTSFYHVQFRMRHRDGHWIHVLARGAAARAADGTPVRMVGTHLDLSDRVHMEERLRQAEARFRAIVEQSVQGFYQATPDGRLLVANAALARMLGYDSAEQLLNEGEGAWDRFHVDPKRRDEYIRQMHSGCSVSGFESALRRRDNRVIWVSENARAVFDPDGSCRYCEAFVDDITARKEAEQLKADFVSFVTHQLRTPLAGIRWMLELAMEGTLPEEPASYVRDAYASAGRLIALVNDLLDVARLESGRLTSTAVPTDFVSLVGDVVRDVQPIADARHQTLTVSRRQIPRVLADPQLTHQAVLNLVSNALKYTPDGGAVSLDHWTDGRLISFEVRDTGIGIPEASRQRLFEKFFRAENAMTIDTEGTGLGLYLVRLIAERSGGEVTCTSQEGHGSTFTMTLPVAPEGIEP